MHKKQRLNEKGHMRMRKWYIIWGNMNNTCQLFSELDSSELVAGVLSRAATTVDTDASEPRLDDGLLLNFHNREKRINGFALVE